ncbi:MAG: NAD(P)H-binding protein [Pseudomonadales bacterium]
MLAITGANGHLGQRLLARLAPSGTVRALVRSERAAGQVRGLGHGDAVDVRVVDYADADALTRGLEGCSGVVHLVGIIKETARNPYFEAHEAACRALARAAGSAGVGRMVYLSIVGSRPDSANACLASKGAAEQILAEGPVATTVIRVPMVLGEGDYAAAALGGRARRGWNVVLRGSSLEQPIYAGDVVDAVIAALEAPPGAPAAAPELDLAGPESLSRTALTHRAAARFGRRTRVISLPLALGMGLAFLFEKLSAEPPVTRAMLGVLDHDDRIDPGAATAALGITLTPLDETLGRCLTGSGDAP